MDPNVQSSAVNRPGFVTFAGVMLLLIGGFEAVWAVTELMNAAWLASSVYGTYGGYWWVWGILDILFALVALYAGYDVLNGGSFGQVFGTLIAGISAIRWFFLLPVLPLGAVIIILIDVLILYGLLGFEEYFESRAATRAVS
jgi:hypothetical protein